MATFNLTQNFSNLSRWPGRLLEDPGEMSIVSKSVTSFVFKHPGTGTDFPDFRFTVTGTGFAYDGNVPVSGNMSTLTIRNGAGAVVMSVSGLAANTLASDLSQFYANVFGSTNDQGDGPGPSGKAAWSHLMSGNDVINGTSGDDRRQIIGTDRGNDRYNMGAGDDYVWSGIGNDTIDGGEGFDTLSYQDTNYNEGMSAFQGITVNMVAGTVVDSWGGSDQIIGVEKIIGSRFNDTFNGSAGRDEFMGLRGRDVFRGGADQDQLRYDEDYWTGGMRGIVVDLQTAVAGAGSIQGRIRDGFGNFDTTFDIERVSGTRFNDTFVGSTQDNSFWGGEGRDSYNGDAGFDSVRFIRWFGDTETGAVQVDMTRATGQIINDGFGNIETMLNIEYVQGGERNDTIRGNSADNVFAGDGGADLLTGGGGNDRFEWYEAGHFGQGDRITDFNASGAAANVDRLGFDTFAFSGMTTTLRLVNGTAATQAAGTFIYNAANDTLFWDRDGTGAAAAVAVVRLDNVAALSAANFTLFD